jgi:hypothetical protein
LIKLTEHQEQVLIFHWAQLASRQDLRLKLLFAIPNAGGYVGGFKANMRRVMSMIAEGLKSGVPDICLPVPIGQYHGLYIELKRNDKKARVSEEQAGWLNSLTEMGYRAVVCYGADEAMNKIKEYLKG